MSVSTWRAHPLDAAVLEVLERKGALTDVELLDFLMEDYKDVGFGELNRVLLKLEVGGRVRVTWLIKGKRRVELIEKKE